MHDRRNFSGKFLELLEIRRFLSSVNVLNYGAVPDDGKDDVAAILAAIRDSKKNDTVVFPAGEFDIGTSVQLKGDRQYIGDGSVLSGGDEFHIFTLHDDNVRIEGFTFDGKALFIDAPGNRMIQNLVVNENTFHVHGDGTGKNGITFTTGLRDSKITNNTFDPISADNGIYGYYWDNLTIANNSFLNGNEGIHVVDFGDVSKDLLIEQNYFSGLHRMGIEYQGGGSNTIVQDNYYENPVMTKNFQDNMSTFAYSIIADRSEGTIIRRNTAIAPDRPDGTGVRIVFEVGGDNTLVEQNYSVGSNHVLAANDGVGTTSVLARNNLFKNYLQGPGGRGLTLQNNGPNAQLDWNVNRGKPGPNVRLGLQGVISDNSANYQPKPVYQASDFKYLDAMDWVSAVSSWGPVERKLFNGGDDANDGGKITLNGRVYETGLGVAGNSEIVYKLDGKYSKFFSDIGIDDYSGTLGSADFQVWVDGKKVYDSGVMTGRTYKKGITIDVRGAKELKLVTTDAGDGINADHADWGGARLLPK
ncbi:MAG TPA: NPCBM/NEW2 domain-containing protein [Tepidisphaeraceae bacterium]|nr:NPCBM/NEW2 domain-containing protein [Tepidisphaeraceae bacterium]